MRISVTALAVFGALVLAGCSSTQDPPTPNTTSPTASQSQDPTTSGNAGQGTPSAGDGVGSGDSKPSGTAVQPAVGSPANNPSSETYIPQWFERITINGTPLLETDVEIIDADDFTKVPVKDSRVVGAPYAKSFGGWNEVQVESTEHYEVLQWRDTELPTSEFHAPEDGARVGFRSNGTDYEFPATHEVFRDEFGRFASDFVSTPTHIYWLEQQGTGLYSFDWRLFAGSIADQKVSLLARSEEYTGAENLPQEARLKLAGNELIVTSVASPKTLDNPINLFDRPNEELSLVDLMFSLEGKLQATELRPRISFVTPDPKSIQYVSANTYAQIRLEDSANQKFDLEINQDGLSGSRALLGFSRVSDSLDEYVTWTAQESAFVYNMNNNSLKIITFSVDPELSAQGIGHSVYYIDGAIEISHLVNNSIAYYAFDLATQKNGRTILDGNLWYQGVQNGMLRYSTTQESNEPDGEESLLTQDYELTLFKIE